MHSLLVPCWCRWPCGWHWASSRLSCHLAAACLHSFASHPSHPSSPRVFFHHHLIACTLLLLYCPPGPRRLCVPFIHKAHCQAAALAVTTRCHRRCQRTAAATSSKLMPQPPYPPQQLLRVLPQRKM